MGPPGENITYVVMTMPNAQILNQIAQNKVIPDIQICTFIYGEKWWVWLNNSFLSYLLCMHANFQGYKSTDFASMTIGHNTFTANVMTVEIA